MSEGEIYTFVARGRRRLNLILMAAAMARALVWAAVGAGMAVLLSRRFGWLNSTLWPWASLTCLGGLIGLGLGWRQRLDRAGAARWLDRRLGLDEALSAALYCLLRGCTGPLDDGVVARAAAASGLKPPIRWPWRYLTHWSLLAAGLLLVSGLIVAFWRPGRAAPTDSLSLRPTSRQSAQAMAGAIPPAVQSPQEVARLLFAQDPGLARQAEQALEAGDTEMLQRLLSAADRKMQARIDQAATPGERRLLQQERQRQREVGNALIKGESGPTAGADNAQTPGRGTGQRSDMTRATERPQGAGTPGTPNPGEEEQDPVERRQDFRRDPGAAGSSANRGTGGSTGAGGLSGQGLQAGRGAGQSRSQWGEIAGKSGRQQAVIGRNQQQTLEYVLPGKNARIPLSLAVSEARRAAEGAIARVSVPLEYLASVRAYFLALSKATTTTPKGVQP